MFAQVAGGESLPTAIGGLGALIVLFITFMKMTSASNERVDSITGGQIRLLAEERDRLIADNRTLSQEANHWETKYRSEVEETTRLRIEAASWQARHEALATELVLRQRGTGPNDGPTSSA